MPLLCLRVYWWGLPPIRSMLSANRRLHIGHWDGCVRWSWSVSCMIFSRNKLKRMNESIPNGHLVFSWRTPLANCSKGLHCWSSRIVPHWLEPVLPLCWSFWGPATGVHARLCQTHTWRLWSCGTDHAGVMDASLWWLDYRRSVLSCSGLVWNLLDLLPAVPQTWPWFGWGYKRTWSCWDCSLGWYCDSSDIARGCLSLVKVWRTIGSNPSAIPSSPRSSGISLSGLLWLPRLHS